MDMNLFEIFKDQEGVKDFEDSQKKIAEENKAASEKKDEKKDNKVSDKKETSEKSKKKAEKAKADPNEKLLKEINNYPKIVLKAYGTELTEIEPIENFTSIDLMDLEIRLINEFNYGEFSEGITWHLVPNSDKTIGYLVATGKFYAKG
ncbi:hypothetical protein [uncultured Clostridium sp.]|uniref:hypothetical protein n=1 Tax=uncultured Clostridium sp. TaxID=59620 RepID=UPI0028E78A94|nr:hypothetical protein [uncultured Clostridium sp.]